MILMKIRPLNSLDVWFVCSSVISSCFNLLSLSLGRATILRGMQKMTLLDDN